MDKVTITGNFYNKYETKNPIESMLMRNFKLKLINLISKLSVKNVYEIGAGEGYILRIIHKAFPEKKLYGSDIDYKLVAKSRHETSQSDWIINSAESLPFSSNSINLLIASEVLEHLHNPHLFLLECQRIRAKYFFFSVPNEPLWRVLNMLRGKYMKDLGNTPGHINHFSKKKMVKLINEYLLIDEIFYVHPWIFILAKNKQ